MLVNIHVQNAHGLQQGRQFAGEDLLGILFVQMPGGVTPILAGAQGVRDVGGQDFHRGGRGWRGHDDWRGRRGWGRNHHGCGRRRCSATGDQSSHGQGKSPGPITQNSTHTQPFLLSPSTFGPSRLGA